MKTIGIDIRKINDFGIGTYIRHLLEGLSVCESESDSETEYRLFIEKNSCNRFFTPGHSEFRTFELTRHRRSPFQGMLPLRTGLTLFHAPHYLSPDSRPVPMVLTVHDCIHLQPPPIPAFYRSGNQRDYVLTAAKRFYHTRQAGYRFRHYVRRASQIIAVSQYTAGLCIRLTGVNPEKVTVIHNCVDEAFHSETCSMTSGEFCDHYNLPCKDYVLYCGNDLYHKNLQALLIAWKHLNNKMRSPLLVLAGPPRKHLISQFAQTLGISNVMVFADRLPPEHMPLLYKNALCLVNPSLAEGFGLPVAEALVSGIPVVCSNLDVFREITEGNALFFNPYDPGDICNALVETLAGHPLSADANSEKTDLYARKFSMKPFISSHKAVYRCATGDV